MILNPWIFGLMMGHSTLLFVHSMGFFHARQIYAGWNYDSSTEKQYLLERKTYLVSTAMNFTMFSQIALLFLFVAAAGELATVLPGAMCAVGTLSSNRYGFPLLEVKIVTFFVYFIWLVVNYLDNQLETYPLVRKKYLALMLIYPLAVLETVLLILFALNLDPSVITSCCGTVYNSSSEGLAATLSGASAEITLPLFFGIITLLLLKRFVFNKRNTYKGNFGNNLEFSLWVAFFITALYVIISFISTYVYRMPSHKCPLCFIGAGYYYFGVPLYICLFGATATGITGGVLGYLKEPAILKEKAITLRKRLDAVSLWGMLAFVVMGFLPFATYYLRTGRLI